MSDPDRRKFLGIATCAIGGGVCAAASVPLIRLVLDPLGKQTVTTPRAPIDIGPEARFTGEPTKIEIVAPVIKDGWAAARDVVLGAAFVRRVDRGIEALSAVCPHLGCAVSFDRGANNYLCPCHESRFAIGGEKTTGPSQRGLDTLPLEVKNGRVLLTWQRYRTGQAKKEPV